MSDKILTEVAVTTKPVCFPRIQAFSHTNSVKKRKKTNRACNHCHKAHMTCDTNRPCHRCVQKGLLDSCEDAPRKRKKYLADVPQSVITQHRNLQSVSPPSQANNGTNHPGGGQFQSTAFQQSSTVPLGFDLSRSNPSNATHLPQNATNLARAATQPLSNIKEENPESLGFYSTSQFLNMNDFPDSKPSTTFNDANFPTVTANTMPNLERKRTNFLSSAADLEYSTLSSILQDNFMHTNPNPSSTSAEGTPNSINLSPALSPHTFSHYGSNQSTSNVRNSISSPPTTVSSGYQQQQQAKSKLQMNPYLSAPSQNQTSRDRKNGRTKSSDLYDNSQFPKCDESINQYFLGSTGSDNMLMFPDVIVAIEAMRESDPAIYHERNSKLKLSFAIGIVPDESHYNLPGDSIDSESSLHFKEPEEIYAKIKKPFSYTKGYHLLIAYLRRRFPREMLVKMAESMAAYRPSFIACTNSLKEGDLIFMEQCFQRTLLTYDNFIRVSGTPTIVWRRTGEIAYVDNEFSILTGWTREELISKKRTFIVELLDDKSVVEYFQLFLKIAFGDFLGATMTECTLLTPKDGVKIRTGCMWTLKRDVFGIPMMIIGNFLPIVWAPIMFMMIKIQTRW